MTSPELILIGCVLLKENTYEAYEKAIMAGITVDHFENPTSRRLWNEILERHNRQEQIDIIWAAEFARNNTYVNEITAALSSVVSPSDAVTAIEVLKNRYLKRQMLSTIDDYRKRLYQGDNPAYICTELGNYFMTLKETGKTTTELDIDTVFAELQSEVMQKYGYGLWDWAIRGAMGAKYIVIYGDTHHGKSVLKQNMCYNLAYNKVPATYMSSEMRGELFAIRLATVACGANPLKFHLQPDEYLRFKSALEDIKELPIEFFYTTSLSEIRLTIQKRRTPVYFIDYLQEIKADKEYRKRNEEIAYVTRELEHMSKDYNCNIVVSSQITPGENLNIHSGKESREIENSADILALLHYPYQQAISMRDTDKMTKLESEGKDKILQLQIVKNRLYGHYPIIDLHFERDKLKISDITKEEAK